MRFRWATCGLAVVFVFTGRMPAEAQQYPLAPRVGEGETLHPFFEGWYPNADGSHSLSFGYFNRNLEDFQIYIPRGENNYVEPAEYDGMQPEWFPVRRERGVFSVTVPPGWGTERAVTWTFVSGGEAFSVPGRWGNPAYELGHNPMASGSLPPLLSLDEDGEEGYGIVEPVRGESRTASVDEPLEITIWTRDNIAPDAAREEEVELGVAMYPHQGPAWAVIVAEQPEPEEEPESGRGGGRGGFGQDPEPNEVTVAPDSDGTANFTVTFSEPGDYLLRVVVDNFSAVDSSSGNQCCWTNGYIPVTVTP